MGTSDLLLVLLCSFGIFQAVLLGITLATLRDGRRRLNRVLAAMLIGTAAVMTAILISHRSGAAGGVGLELFEVSLWPFAGPLAYYYVTLVSSGERSPTKAFALHLVPGALLLGHLAIWWLGSALGFAVPGRPWLPPVQWMMLHQTAYTILAFGRWRSARAKDPDRSTLGLHAYWAPALLAVLSIVHSAQLVRWLFHRTAALEDVVPLAGSAALVVATAVGLRAALPRLGPKRRRYTGSALSRDRARQIVERLEGALEAGRSYLRHDLTLDELATELAVPKTYLSQVVNEHFRQSLPDLLAGYRLRESERLLADPGAAHLTIEAVARRSGFASRSTFYEAFRRRHSITPAQFRKRLSET